MFPKYWIEIENIFSLQILNQSFAVFCDNNHDASIYDITKKVEGKVRTNVIVEKIRFLIDFIIKKMKLMMNEKEKKKPLNGKIRI